MITDLARAFIKTQIETKALKLQRLRAEQFAMASLRKTIYNPNPEAWRVNHPTPAKALESWVEAEKPYNDKYERWRGDEYNYGRFGPDNYANYRPAGDNKVPSAYPIGPPVIPAKPQGLFVNKALVHPPPFDPPAYPYRDLPLPAEKSVHVDRGDVREIFDVFARMLLR
ncbi:hypothetical protein SCHPADRAFT_947601 [Schizopora paradoxa]|uniref:Uncharacterized protein n=1 Tax=Schizopora paradoxa TaxID=27342 RepID=A0A0H2R526_9AGAM|nr:hypothetical protein SCHPADRAFT_947601 [Schizopora paradoxa]